jgi:hypothetical protein
MTTKTMTASQRAALLESIEVAFMAHTGAGHTHGAVGWIAGQLGVNRRTVERWLNGEKRMTRQSRTAVANAEALVRLTVGVPAWDEAQARWLALNK